MEPWPVAATRHFCGSDCALLTLFRRGSGRAKGCLIVLADGFGG